MEKKSLKIKPDLSVNLCGKKLKNPLVLASGILGDTVVSLKKAIDCGLAGVVSKSTSWEPRKGHPKPWIVKIGEFGLINAVGLANVGVKAEINKLKKLRKLTIRQKPAIIASIFGSTIEKIGRLAREISKARPDFIEVNISCPHADSTVRGSFYNNPEATRRLTQVVKKNTKIPIIIKLSPNVEDIASIAKAAEEGGADAIAAINTLGPGMAIDVETGRPVLGNKIGGLSGPAIKPIAIRCVYQIAQAVRVPIIGIGGTTNGRDAVEMIMAGAWALGIGSAFYLKGPEVYQEIIDSLKNFMIKHHYKGLRDFRGLALK
jgi:dihydroorotate dehydrogenase (NAD+) catalytic subunit